jgi:hypothetical protein
VGVWVDGGGVKYSTGSEVHVAVDVTTTKARSSVERARSYCVVKGVEVTDLYPTKTMNLAEREHLPCEQPRSPQLCVRHTGIELRRLPTRSVRSGLSSWVNA